MVARPPGRWRPPPESGRVADDGRLVQLERAPSAVGEAVAVLPTPAPSPPMTTRVATRSPPEYMPPPSATLDGDPVDDQPTRPGGSAPHSCACRRAAPSCRGDRAARSRGAHPGSTERGPDPRAPSPCPPSGRSSPPPARPARCTARRRRRSPVTRHCVVGVRRAGHGEASAGPIGAEPSTAPMSHAPAAGRLEPRWSTARLSSHSPGVPTGMASTAPSPAKGRRVLVGPP